MGILYNVKYKFKTNEIKNHKAKVKTIINEDMFKSMFVDYLKEIETMSTKEKEVIYERNQRI